MPCYRLLPFSILTTILFFSLTFFTFCRGGSHFPTIQATHFSGKVIEGNYLISRGTKRVLAEGTNDEPVLNSSLVLAAKRTYRKDPLDDFKKYTGGWNISERHYWASVGFTAAPLFVIAAI
ncbi:unnamed protein product, partial [Ilex paraguariensis]